MSTKDPQPRDPGLPDDPDVTTWDISRARGGLLHGQLHLLAVIAVGGALGSVGRCGVALALPHGPGSIPWSTVTVNVVGSLLIGILLVLVTERWPEHRYARPFLGVGVLGGFTTFSAYAMDAHALLGAGAVGAAAAYLAVTLVGGLLAVWLGVSVTRTALRAGPRA